MMKSVFATLALCALLLAAQPASAATITFQYALNFGSTTLTGAAPWMVGSLSDDIGNGDLLLTLNTDGLATDGASIDEVYFNFDPAKTLAGLNVALGPTDTTGGAYLGSTIGVDCCRADGDGYFDIRLNFDPGADPPVFESNDTISFVLSHSLYALTLDDLIFQSAAGPGNSPGPFYSAAHVQSINTAGGDSTWIATQARPTLFEVVPDGGSMAMLLGMGLLGLAALRRRL